jgi:cation transport regulator ChaB
MSEARDLLKSANFTESAMKYLEAAKKQDDARGIEHAKDLYMEAIRGFIHASEDYKDKKQFRKSSENLFYVAQIYKQLNAKDDWVAATKAIVEDLINAAQEYLLWSDYNKAVVLISSACFFLFSIEDFTTAEQLYSQYISQIQNDPGFTSAQQILYAAGHAIKAVKEIDTQALINAQQLVGNQLKPGLNQIMGDLFFPAIDSAVDTVVKKFRSKIKLPKIVPELKISKDLVIGNPTPLVIIVENEGKGNAFNIQLQLNLPEEIELLDGVKNFIIEDLPAQQSSDNKLLIRCLSATGESIHEISATIIYYDQLQTKQTMMIGPYELTFREKSLVNELEKSITELTTLSDEHYQKLVQTTILPEEVCEEIYAIVPIILKKSEEEIKSENFGIVQANIEIIKTIHQIADNLMKEAFVNSIKETQNQKIEEKVQEAMTTLKEELEQSYEERSELVKQELLLQKETEIANIQEQLRKQKDAELEELMAKLNKEHAKELEEARQEIRKEMEKELEEYNLRFDNEKKQALEEQEALLRDEFQKQLSDAQNHK